MSEKAITAAQKAYILRTKEARKACGKERPEVAKYLGVHVSTYSNWEYPKQNRPMPQEYISRFCEFTGTNERWLISNKGRREADYVEKLEALVKDHIANLQNTISPDSGQKKTFE